MVVRSSDSDVKLLVPAGVFKKIFCSDYILNVAFHVGFGTYAQSLFYI